MQYRRSKTKGEFDIQVTPNIKGELDWFLENSRLYGSYVLPIIMEIVEPENLDEYLKQSRKRFNRNLKRPCRRSDGGSHYSQTRGKG